MVTTQKDKFIASIMQPTVADILPQHQEIREAALSQLQQIEVPTTKVEQWKYTNVKSLFKQELTVQQPNLEPLSIDGLEQFGAELKLVFVDGYFSPLHSNTTLENTDAAIEVKPLANARIENVDDLQSFNQLNDSVSIFSVLNTAFNFEGSFIKVGKNQKVESPVLIVNYTSGKETVAQPRNSIVCESGSEIEVLYVQKSLNATSSGLTNILTEIWVGENAKVDFQILQDVAENQQIVQNTFVQQLNDSTFTTGNFTFGGKLVRNDLNIKVDGQNCDTHLNGIYHLNGKQHVDNHTVVDHTTPNCESNENYKGIVNDNATAVFNGKVFVRREAQKTNAFQSNQNLLITDDATAYSKPELEIYADDVKCSHGSTTGQLDEEALFYLQSRGLSTTTAQKLLITAFTQEALELVKNEGFREMVREAIENKSELING